MIDYSFSMQDLEYFLLIMTRVSCFIYIAPFFGTQNVPWRVKVGLSFFTAFLLYEVMTPHEALEYSTVLGYAILVVKEGITGLLIGFGAIICNSIVLLAGKVADMEIGLSMVQMMDPLTKEASGFTGILYQYGVLMILFIMDAHHYILRAFVDSYSLAPVGGVHINTDKLLIAITQFMVDYMSIAFRICLPIVASMLILNCVLGVLAKVAPQMNMFSVGIQIKILTGMSILFLTIGMLPNVANFIFEEMKIMMTAFAYSLQ